MISCRNATLSLAIPAIILACAFQRPAAGASEAVTLENLVADWALQDMGSDASECFVSKNGCGVETRMLTRVLDELGQAGLAMRSEMGRLIQAKVPGNDTRWR